MTGGFSLGERVDIATKGVPLLEDLTQSMFPATSLKDLYFESSYLKESSPCWTVLALDDVSFSNSICYIRSELIRLFIILLEVFEKLSDESLLIWTATFMCVLPSLLAKSDGCEKESTLISLPLRWVETISINSGCLFASYYIFTKTVLEPWFILMVYFNSCMTISVYRLLAPKLCLISNLIFVWREPPLLSYRFESSYSRVDYWGLSAGKA